MALSTDTVNHYIEMLPMEVRLPATALKDERHWAIFLYLIESGEKRFGEIRDRFGIKNNNDLDPILKKLVEGGLVRRFMKDNGQDRDRRATWYQPTDLGSRYLDLLEGLVLPGIRSSDIEKREYFYPQVQKSSINYFVQETAQSKYTVVA